MLLRTCITNLVPRLSPRVHAIIDDLCTHTKVINYSMRAGGEPGYEATYIPSSLPPSPSFPPPTGGDHLRVLPVPPAAAAEEGGQGSHGHPASMVDSQEALAQSL